MDPGAAMATEKGRGTTMSKTWIPTPHRLSTSHERYRYVPHQLCRVRRIDGSCLATVMDVAMKRLLGATAGISAVEVIDAAAGSVADVVLKACDARANKEISRKHARRARKACRAAKRLEARSPWARRMMRDVRNRPNVFTRTRNHNPACHRMLVAERKLKGVSPACRNTEPYDTRPFGGATRNLRYALRVSAEAGEFFRVDVVESVRADAVKVVAFFDGEDQPPAAWQALLRERARSRATRRLSSRVATTESTRVDRQHATDADSSLASVTRLHVDPTDNIAAE